MNSNEFVDLYLPIMIFMPIGLVMIQVMCFSALATRQESVYKQLDVLPALGYTRVQYQIIQALAPVTMLIWLIDSRHPRGEELKEHRQLLRYMKHIQGPAAEAARQELRAEIEAIEQTAVQTAAIDGNDHIRSLIPELETLRALREDRDEIYIDGREETLRQLG